MSNLDESPPTPRPWITRTVLGIVLATFLSDFSHEACTAVLPLYLGAIGLGPAALGLIEGISDFLVSLSKLGGGVVGHRVRHKRPWAALGYVITALGTAGIGLVRGLAAILSLRSVAWIARGFRGPLRDYLMADAVAPTHYGRAFGLERAGDMLGAVAGPLAAVALLWIGLEFRVVILWSVVPGLLAAGAMFFLTKERVHEAPAALEAAPVTRAAIPKRFWLFLVGVLLFGLGDFSRTFLIWLAAADLGESKNQASGAISVAVLLFALHNLVSAGAALVIGRLSDRRPKLPLLVAGYALGVGTNLLLAVAGGMLPGLTVAILLSAIYIAAEETLEKAVAAEWLPRELRSLGFGVLACGNAVGDMASSLYVGYLLEAGRPAAAFAIAAAIGLVGVLWLAWFARSIGRTVVA